ncbi:PQQ-binding-like beta-propeller repeat protein [Propionibacteriaceae bacterium Y1685]
MREGSSGGSGWHPPPPPPGWGAPPSAQWPQAQPPPQGQPPPQYAPGQFPQGQQYPYDHPYAWPPPQAPVRPTPPEPKPGNPLVQAAVIAVVIALMAATLAAVDRIPGTPKTAAARFLPADGYATTLIADDRSLSSEWARLAGAEASLILGGPLALGVLAALGDDLDTATLFRRTLTGFEATDNLGRTEVYRVDEEVRAVAGLTPKPYVFGAGILLLGRDPTPGQRLTSSGTTTDQQRWTAITELTAATPPQNLTVDGSCLQVSGQVTVAGETTPIDQTWCAGTGIVAEVVTADGESTSWVTGADQPSPSLSLPAHRLGTNFPVGTSRPVSSVLAADRTPLLGTPIAHPVRVTSDGLFARVVSGQDISVLEPDGDQLVQRRRLHAGGTVMSMSTIGPLVVVNSSQRDTVAWDARSGRRLWSSSSDDVGQAPAVVLDPSTILIATVAGTLRALDAGSGTERWTATVAGGVTTAPVVQGGLVVVVTGRAVHALDPATGELRWSQDVDTPGPVAVVGDIVWVVTDPYLEQRRSSDGARVARSRLSASEVSLLPYDGGLLVSSTAGLSWYDGGTEQWHRPDPCVAVTPFSQNLACWTTDQLVVVDRFGAEQHREQVSPATVGVRTALADATDAWLFSTNWEAWRWAR